MGSKELKTLAKSGGHVLPQDLWAQTNAFDSDSLGLGLGQEVQAAGSNGVLPPHPHGALTPTSDVTKGIQARMGLPSAQSSRP